MSDAAFPDGPIWLVGCGHMAGAMLARWLESGLDPTRVTAIIRSGSRVPAGVRALTAPPTDETPAIVILGVKPQQLPDVAPMLAAIRPGVLVSILAGVEAATLAALVPGVPVIRAMPNLPVAIGKGAVALYADRSASCHGKMVAALMAPLGLVEWVDEEAQLDVVAALSGSGPAFVYRVIDALAAAGASLGLPDDQAMRLALSTVEGAGVMAMAADTTPAVLADRVASPGGSTRRGLDVLDRDDALQNLMTATLTAAVARNREMAAAARASG